MDQQGPGGSAALNEGKPDPTRSGSSVIDLAGSSEEGREPESARGSQSGDYLHACAWFVRGSDMLGSGKLFALTAMLVLAASELCRAA